MAAQKWRKIWGTRNTGNHFGIYRYGDAWTLLGCKISPGILQKVHFLIWKPLQLPYSMVNISVNVAVIRDFNENLVAAKVEVIVCQCWLEAHFAGFWHALQLCKNGTSGGSTWEPLRYWQFAIAAFNMDSPKTSYLKCSVQQSETSNI